MNLAEDLFADTNTATGETVAYLDDVSQNNITDLSGAHQDQQLSRNQENGEENGESQNHTTSSRKRALTASTPVLTSAKKSKTLDVISEKLDVMVEAMKKSLETTDKDHQLIRDAVACWNRELKAKPSEIKLAFTKEWRKDPRKALEFILLEPHDRQYLVQEWITSKAKEGRNGHENDKSVSQKRSDEDLDHLIEELDGDQWAYLRNVAMGWEAVNDDDSN